MADKPAILILGGTGCVGRHLVKILVESGQFSKIRVADKKMPVTSFLSDEYKAIFDNPIVEYKQVNLSNGANARKIFTVDNNAYKFKYAVNLAAETRYGQEEPVYKQHVFDLSVVCAKEAAAHGVDKYIEVSTAQVYEPGKKASNETSKLKPWTKLAKFKAQAEEEIKKIGNLNWIILRPTTIYGDGDINGLAPRILCAVTYTQTKEKMKLLWSADMRIDVVSAIDVARAIVHCWEKVPVKSVYNLNDKSELTQKKLNDIFTELFGIETGFLGSIISNLASLSLKSAAEAANEQHLNPWGELLKTNDIKTTPLSPYIDVEMMYNTPLSVDGTAIEQTGFKYEKPTLNKAEIEAFISYWKKLKLFPDFKKL